MLVTQINISEFRGIKKCESPLKLSRIVVLIGRNNAGKSSVLEALSLLPLMRGYNIPSHSVDRMQFIADLHAGHSSILHVYSGAATIEYLIGNAPFCIKIDENRNVEITTETEKFDINVGAALEKIAEVFNTTKEEIRKNETVLFFPNNTLFLDKLKTAIEREPLKNSIIKSGAHFRVINELINKCVDDKYSEVIFSPGLQARKEPSKGTPYYVKIKDLGDGIERVTLITMFLEAIKPRLILWDDFEASVHPSLIKELLKWLFIKDWQVVISTHSIDVLSGLLDVTAEIISKSISDERLFNSKKLDSSDFKILQLQKGGDDVLKHRELSLEDLENLFDANQDPRLLVDLLKL